MQENVFQLTLNATHSQHEQIIVLKILSKIVLKNRLRIEQTLIHTAPPTIKIS